MTDQQIGRLLVLLAVGVATAIRWPHIRRNAQVPVVQARKTSQEQWLLMVAFLGMMVIPLVYCIYPPVFAFAEFEPWPGQILAGAVLFAAALMLFWRSHTDLGTNWSPTLEVRQAHALITNGVYRRVRHPMYASIWLWGIAQALLLPNGVAGTSTLIAFLPMYLLRTPREEQMMLDTFGDDYRAYMSRAGRILPRWGRNS